MPAVGRSLLSGKLGDIFAYAQHSAGTIAYLIPALAIHSEANDVPVPIIMPGVLAEPAFLDKAASHERP